MALTVKQRVFPYLVVVAGCALCLGPVSLSFSCAGIFYTPVSEALGVGKGTFSLYMTFFYLTETVSLPFLGRVVERCDLRVVMSLSVLGMGIPLMLMSQFTQVWQFYLAGAIMGVGNGPVLYLAVPTLMTRWFEKRVGFYTGICMAFTGIGGVIFNAVGGALIASGPDGWRLGYFVFGVLLLVIALPCTVFCIRSHPEDIGLAPVGSAEWRAQAGLDRAAAADLHISAVAASDLQASDAATSTDLPKPAAGALAADPQVFAAAANTTSQTLLAANCTKKPARGVTAKEAARMPSFYAMLLFAFAVSALIMLYLFFPSYATSLGATYPQVAALSAVLASVTMAGQAVGKVLLGAVDDRSVHAGLLLVVVCGVAGVMLLWLVPNLIPLFLLAGFLYGILYATETVQMPAMARSIFGTDEYTVIYARITTVSSLGGVLFASAWGFLIEGAGYAVAFCLALVLLAMVLGCGAFALRAAAQRFPHA